MRLSVCIRVHLLGLRNGLIFFPQWWEEQGGRFICRRDERHQVRRFELGVDLARSWKTGSWMGSGEML